MVEPEVAFYDLVDNMDLAERFLKRIFRDVLAQCADDMAFFNEHYDKTTIETLEKIVERVPPPAYTEAVEILKNRARSSSFRSSGESTCSPSTSAT
jgi:asparaginyl-tRNA synthetase